MATPAERQKAYRERQAAKVAALTERVLTKADVMADASLHLVEQAEHMTVALEQIVARLLLNDKPLAIEIREMALRGLGR